MSQRLGYFCIYCGKVYVVPSLATECAKRCLDEWTAPETDGAC